MIDGLRRENPSTAPRGRSALVDAPSDPRPAQQPSAAAADPRCFRRAVRPSTSFAALAAVPDPGRHPSSPPSPWSAGAGGGLQWTPYQRAAPSDAFTRVLGDHRRCPNPAELTAPGSVWSPNARWARIRTHWNALGRAQSVSTDGGYSPWEAHECHSKGNRRPAK